MIGRPPVASTFGGLRIVVVPDDPRYMLPEEVLPGVPWPAGFRDGINAWASGFFAPVTRLADGQVLSANGAAYMNVANEAQPR